MACGTAAGEPPSDNSADICHCRYLHVNWLALLPTCIITSKAWVRLISVYHLSIQLPVKGPGQHPYCPAAPKQQHTDYGKGQAPAVLAWYLIS